MLSDQFLRSVSLKREGVPSFAEYPFNIPAVRHLDTLDLHPEVTFLVGENGTGKSTLLEAVAVAAGFNPEGGSRNFNFSTRETHAGLHEHLRLVRGVRRPRDGFFLRAETFYNAATYLESLEAEGGLVPYGGESLHACSHGEAFMTLMTERLRGNGLYVFDEPEAALSPTRQMALLSLMAGLARENSQFIIATHSPILMAFPGAEILSCDGGKITPIAYDEIEHVAITRTFLQNPQRYMRHLGILDES